MKKLNLFKWLTLLGTILALSVVVLGAYVRLSDAGLGCPDWPGCYGALSVPQSEAAILKAQQVYPDKPIETAKAWKEMAHRYLAGMLGLIVLAVCGLAWNARCYIKVSPLLPTILLIMIIFQAMLGMWTVTMLLKPAIVSAHLIGGMATLALLTWITHRHWGILTNARLMDPTLTLLIRGAIIILLAQIFLGGWTSTNYAALACTDFPTCHGVWIPNMDFKDAYYMVRELGKSASGGNLNLEALTAIQWAHRLGAFITFIYFVSLALMLMNQAQFRKLALLLLITLVAQITIGIANLVLQLPLILAVAHNFGAALLVIITIVINSKITRSHNRT
ncbi:MAG: COX15/CtaA family protein [Methylotenera sp.]|nr:COX15/CtaA family protein [Methylotenera sp.]